MGGLNCSRVAAGHHYRCPECSPNSNPSRLYSKMVKAAPPSCVHLCGLFLKRMARCPSEYAMAWRDYPGALRR